MPKIPERPFFCPSARRAVLHETLAEHEDYTIDKVHGVISMSTIAPWCDQHTVLARKHKIDELYLTTQSFGDREVADFLVELPWLTRLSIQLYSVKDLTAVGRLERLESLRLHYTVWRLGDRFPSVDFSVLKRLLFADVMICPAFDSLLRCDSIQQLAVSNDCDRKLRDLDLSRLRALRDLQLDPCPELQRVSLHPQARVRALRLSLCGSYQIGWERVGPDLRFLILGGRINFPLENILKAPNLEELHCLEIRKLPPLGFLGKLPKLRHVLLFAAPPGPILSDEDRETVRQINRRANRK
jgi:hypothetical protein